MTGITAPSPAKKFEYGRHETFTIRHGWLGKGLSRLSAEMGFDTETSTADALGLGSRMVKSLGYWLEATNLATPEIEGRSRTLGPSEIGQLIEQV